nr:reverse transcriptase domain-containing protein [Tanacetum cinerariifolium]
MKEMLQNYRGHNLSKGNIIKIFYHGLSKITQEVLNAAAGGIFLYKTPNQAYQLLKDKVLLKLDWAKNHTSLKKTIPFTDEVQRIQSRARQPTPDRDDDDMPMSHEEEEEAKFMQTFLAKNHQASIQNLETKFDRLADKQSGRPSGSLPSNTQLNPRGCKASQPPQARNEHVNIVFTRSGKSYNPPDNPDDQQNNFENPINFDSDDEDDEPTLELKTQRTNPVNKIPLPKPYKPKISIDVIDELLKEDFDALLNEGSKILHFIE